MQKAVNFLLYTAPQIIAHSVLVQQNKVHFFWEDAAAVGILLGLVSSHARLRRQPTAFPPQQHRDQRDLCELRVKRQRK